MLLTLHASFVPLEKSTVLCSSVSIVDYLPNDQNERRITPGDYVRLYNKECIWQLFRGAAYGIIATQNKMYCTEIQFNLRFSLKLNWILLDLLRKYSSHRINQP